MMCGGQRLLELANGLAGFARLEAMLEQLPTWKNKDALQACIKHSPDPPLAPAVDFHAWSFPVARASPSDVLTQLPLQSDPKAPLRLEPLLGMLCRSAASALPATAHWPCGAPRAPRARTPPPRSCRQWPAALALLVCRHYRPGRCRVRRAEAAQGSLFQASFKAVPSSILCCVLVI